MRGMPWRRKPNSRLRYWSSGPPSDDKARGFKTILVYCVGRPIVIPALATGITRQCRSNVCLIGTGICAHFKCTQCGSVGWVDPRPNWCEVIDYNKGIS